MKGKLKTFKKYWDQLPTKEKLEFQLKSIQYSVKELLNLVEGKSEDIHQLRGQVELIQFLVKTLAERIDELEELLEKEK